MFPVAKKTCREPKEMRKEIVDLQRNNFGLANPAQVGAGGKHLTLCACTCGRQGCCGVVQAGWQGRAGVAAARCSAAACACRPGVKSRCKRLHCVLQTAAAHPPHRFSQSRRRGCQTSWPGPAAPINRVSRHGFWTEDINAQRRQAPRHQQAAAPAAACHAAAPAGGGAGHCFPRGSASHPRCRLGCRSPLPAPPGTSAGGRGPCAAGQAVAPSPGPVHRCSTATPGEWMVGHVRA